MSLTFRSPNFPNSLKEEVWELVSRVLQRDKVEILLFIRLFYLPFSILSLIRIFYLEFCRSPCTWDKQLKPDTFEKKIFLVTGDYII